jgi:hypothetical protein
VTKLVACFSDAEVLQVLYSVLNKITFAETEECFILDCEDLGVVEGGGGGGGMLHLCVSYCKNYSNFMFMQHSSDQLLYDFNDCLL